MQHTTAITRTATTTTNTVPTTVISTSFRACTAKQEPEDQEREEQEHKIRKKTNSITERTEFHTSCQAMWWANRIKQNQTAIQSASTRDFLIPQDNKRRSKHPKNTHCNNKNTFNCIAVHYALFMDRMIDRSIHWCIPGDKRCNSVGIVCVTNNLYNNNNNNTRTQIKQEKANDNDKQQRTDNTDTSLRKCFLLRKWYTQISL